MYQAVSLGCFPNVKIFHTSAKHDGQVYIPELNYLIMVTCVIVTSAFKTVEKIDNAYGVVVVNVCNGDLNKFNHCYNARHMEEEHMVG